MKRTAKRTAALALALILLLALLPGSVLAAGSDWNVATLDDGTVVITGYKGSDTELVIPSTIGGKTVTRIGTNAFYGNTGLTSVKIPDSVTSIEEGAFYFCENLTSVTIGSGVTSIGERAFSDCYGLTSVLIPDGVTSIDRNAFSFCRGLTSITIGKGVTSIGDYAFSYCDSLTSVLIPDGVKHIGEGVFSSCVSLTNINVASGNSAYSSIDGVLFNKDKTTLITYPVSREGAYSIPNSVTCVDSRAFFSCHSLTGVTIPDSVTSIGTGAFGDCQSLTSVTIPDSVTSIGDDAFANTGLTSVTIGSGVTSIGQSAFYACGSLMSVTFGSGVSSVGPGAFAGCDMLTEINVAPGNGTYSSIDGVLFNKDKTSLIQYPAGKKGTYTIPNGVTTIAANAFISSLGLTGVTIPDSVTSIGEEAFFGCFDLVSVEIPASVTSIGSGAFQDCISMTSVEIPASVTSIGNYAFDLCPSLMEINVASNNKEYCSIDGVLFNKGKTTLIACPGGKQGAYSIPDGVTRIGVGAFGDCGSLTSVIIPDSVTGISYLSFAGCCSLTSLVIPDSVVSIEPRAFEQCTGLTSVTFGKGMTYISGASFFNCSSLTSVTIPNTVTAVYLGAFEACSSLTDVYYGGSEDAWTKVEIESINDSLLSAQLHYGAEPAPDPAPEIIDQPKSVLAAAGDSVKFSVKASGSDLAYQWQYSTDGGKTWKNSPATGNQTATLTVPATESRNGYQYRCVVKSGAAEVTSKAATLTVKTETAPVITAQPQSVTAASGSTVKFTVAASGSDLAYQWQYSTDGGKTWKNSPATGNQTATLTVPATESRNGYQYRCVVKSGAAEATSDAATLTVKAVDPAVPILTSATVSEGKITLEWTEVSGATKYAVYRKTEGESWTLLNNSVSATAYTDETADLKDRFYYVYTVKAYVDGAWGSYDDDGVIVEGVSGKPGTSGSSVVPVLTGATASDGKITVKWKIVTGATEYAVYRKTSKSADWAPLKDGITGTSYNDKNVKAGTTYYYTVSACVDDVWSDYDASGVSVMAVPPTPVLSTVTASDGKITVKWEAVTGATEYAVLRKTSKSADWAPLKDGITGTSYNDKNVEAGTTYYYTVKACANGAWSNYDTAGLSKKALSAAPKLSGATAAAGQITVTWEAVPGATAYQVYRKISGTGWKMLTKTVTGTSFIDKSAELEAGTTYYYTVSAYLEEKDSWTAKNSTGVSAKAVVAIPVLVSAKADGGQVTVKWNKVPGATKYAVLRRTSQDSEWETIKKGITGTSYTDKSKDLKEGTTYTYTVKAYGWKGTSNGWGKYDDVGVKARIASSAVPVLSSAKYSDNGKITVTWKEVAGATKYAIIRKMSGESWEDGTVLNMEFTGTSYTDKLKGYKTGDTYIYSVRAYTVEGWGAGDIAGVSATVPSPEIPILTSAAAAAGQIKVTWKAVAGATAYRVYRKTSGTKWELIKDSVTGTSYTDKSAALKPGITYRYTVKAFVGNAWKDYDPAGVSAKAIALDSAAVTKKIKNYYNSVTKATKGGTAYWNEGLSTATLMAQADNGDYASAVTEKACSGNRNDDGTHSKCTSNEFTGISMTKGRQCAGFADYMIYVIFGSVNSDDFYKATKYTDVFTKDYVFQPGDLLRWNGHSVVVYKVSGDTVSFIECNYGGKNCIIRLNYITSRNKSVAELRKTIVNYGYIMIPKAKLRCNVPGLKATAEKGQVKVTWKEVSGATKYEIYRKTESGTKWGNPIATVTGTSYTDKSVSAGTTYTYAVRAYVNDWGNIDPAGVSVKAK